MIESYVRELLKEIRSLDKRVRSLETRGQASPMYVSKAREVILSSGAFTGVFGYYIVLPEAGANDDLDTISHMDVNVPQEGKKILLRTSTGNAITVKDGTGNIDLAGAGGDVLLDNPAKTLVLVYDIVIGKWIVYSKNA